MIVFVAHFLIVLAAWTVTIKFLFPFAFALADRLPELSLRLGAGPGAPLASAAVAAATLLPITLCIGATFPFAVRVLARSPDHTVRRSPSSGISQKAAHRVPAIAPAVFTA